MTRSIGSAVDWRRLAELNRPEDATQLSRAVVELAERGLSERDIADALRLDPGAVRRLLLLEAGAALAAHRSAWSAR